MAVDFRFHHFFSLPSFRSFQKLKAWRLWGSPQDFSATTCHRLKNIPLEKIGLDKIGQSTSWSKPMEKKKTHRSFVVENIQQKSSVANVSYLSLVSWIDIVGGFYILNFEGERLLFQHSVPLSGVSVTL